MPKRAISSSVIHRLPRYYRYLSELEQKGVIRISSKALSERMGLTASQIRQDLNCFGGFGQQGYGYTVAALREEIERILGIRNRHRTIIVGIGNLGRTIATHIDFLEHGCELVGLFDSNPTVAGRDLAGMQVHHTDTLEGFIRMEQPKVAVLCIPREAAHDVAERLVQLGIRAFWNFSQADLRLSDPSVLVENVFFGDSLSLLAYGLNQPMAGPADE